MHPYKKNTYSRPDKCSSQDVLVYTKIKNLPHFEFSRLATMNEPEKLSNGPHLSREIYSFIQ